MGALYLDPTPLTEAFLEAVLYVSVDHIADNESQDSCPNEKRQKKFASLDTARTLEKENQSEDLKDERKWVALFTRRRIFFFIQHNFFSHV